MFCKSEARARANVMLFSSQIHTNQLLGSEIKVNLSFKYFRDLTMNFLFSSLSDLKLSYRVWFIKSSSFSFYDKRVCLVDFVA